MTDTTENTMPELTINDYLNEIAAVRQILHAGLLQTTEQAARQRMNERAEALGETR